MSIPYIIQWKYVKSILILLIIQTKQAYKFWDFRLS